MNGLFAPPLPISIYGDIRPVLPRRQDCSASSSSSRLFQRAIIQSGPVVARDRLKA
jgi:hypothetical protein